MTNAQQYHSDHATYTVPDNGRVVSAFVARRFERRFGRGSWAEYLWTHETQTHTQINTCPNCGQRDEWQVSLTVTAHDWHNWCFACLRKLSGGDTEPSDASGYGGDVSVMIIRD